MQTQERKNLEKKMIERRSRFNTSEIHKSMPFVESF